MAGTATRLITACKLILLGTLLYTVSLTAAAELVPIAVVDFTASSSTPYRSSLPEMVVNELVSSNKFDVLEREKLGSIIGEIGFQSASGFVPPDKAVQVGGMLGASLLVTGHVLDHGREQQSFSGYGVRSTKTIYRLKARMEVVDVASGRKLFSHVAQARDERQVVQGQNYDQSQRDLSEKVARLLVAKMLASDRISAITSAPELVSIAVESVPAEADVEIDGIYYGMAGDSIQLVPGNHEIKVSLPGYLEWTKIVLVRDGARIRARLMPDNTTRSESKVEIDVQ